jgi:O-antigen/teichoic acid export membrane protein
LLLSISVFLSILGTGEMTVMQGLRRYKQLAFCSIVPPLCGLLLSVPIYYVWGIDGIVPAMILSGAIYYLVMRHYSFRDRRNKSEKEQLSLRTVWKQGHDIIQLGLVMTFGTIVGTITTYSLMAFISNMGSVSDVGFYQAANIITVQYVSMIFTAMATDYYPRLSAVYHDSKAEAHLLVNQQTEVVLLSITPLAMLMILTAPLLISILLTDEFQTIRPLIYFLGLANIFKALCFPMDYIAYAKGDKKYILWVETVWGNFKTFTVIAGCYLQFGLIGLGYGALASAIIDVLVSIVLTRWRYGFRLSGSVLRLLAVMLLLSLSCFFGAFAESNTMSYAIMSATTLFCIGYSLAMLNRRMNLVAVLKRMKGGKA